MSTTRDWFEASCGMAFSCPKGWNGLTPTGDKKIRFCEECKQKIHLVDSEAEFTRLTAAGQTVAVQEGDEILMVGISDCPECPRNNRD